MTAGNDAPSLTDASLAARLSARFVEAVTTPCLAWLDDLLTDDFSIYYGMTGKALPRAEALEFFRGYFPTIRLRYRDIRLKPTTNGWVQQHIVDTDGENGFRIRDLHVCMVVTMDGEKISHIAEYLDSAQAGGFDSSRLGRAG